MTPVIAASLRIYGALIRLYPADLQRRYGPEMRDVFEEQLVQSCTREGLTGLVRVWLWVVAEVLRSPVPFRLIQGLVSVPIISVITSSFLFLIFYRVFYYVAGLTDAAR
jgi:hypothetical protein